jgi:cysteinyl-tRNA synthetase
MSSNEEQSSSQLSDTDREIADPAYRVSEGPTSQRVLPQAAGLRIYDTRTHTIETFTPLTAGQVRIYVCGATVQSAPHIGHMRAAVAFDVVRRWMLRLGYDVVFVRNVTDIDDKILAKAAAAHQQWWARAYHYERVFTRAYRLLGVIPPTYEPRATGHMPEMIALVNRLIARGHAYVIPNSDGTPSGNVFFDVRSWPDYGELTHQSTGTLQAEKREDADAQTADRMGPSIDQTGPDPNNPVSVSDQALAHLKHDPRDFALWKAAKPDEPATAQWDAPFGKGRPGWHLECSAMSHRYLGDDFDIHGGGLDLRFPHHENEMAQSRAAGWGFAHHWMHSAWVTAKGEKMSKSLGNGLSVDTVLSHYSAWVVRYALATVHYRAMLEWSDATLRDAQAASQRISRFLSAAQEIVPQPTRAQVTGVMADELPEAFVNALNNDFDVSSAIAVVFQRMRAGNALIQTAADHPEQKTDLSRDLLLVRAMLDVFGLDPLSPVWSGASSAAASGSDQANGEKAALDQLVQVLLKKRTEARAARDFATADQLRDQLADAGIQVEDTPHGPRWSLARHD